MTENEVKKNAIDLVKNIRRESEFQDERHYNLKLCVVLMEYLISLDEEKFNIVVEKL